MKRKVSQDGELLDTLFILFNDLSKKKIKNYLKSNAVMVNDKVVTKYDYLVNKNDVIEINKINKTHKKSSVNIIYEDSFFLVVDKPSGILSIGTNKERERTVYHLVREFIKGRNKNDKIFILHRLDKDTSGVLVFVKDYKLKNILQENWDKYVSQREYYAVISGHIKDLNNYICYLKEMGPDKVCVTNSKDNNSKKSVTSISNLKSNKKYSLVKVNIKTGRRNQIRVVLSSLGNPIIGDKKYGGIKKNRLYLHANKISLYNPLNNKKYIFEAKVPLNFFEIVGGVYE